MALLPIWCIFPSLQNRNMRAHVKLEAIGNWWPCWWACRKQLRVMKSSTYNVKIVFHCFQPIRPRKLSKKRKDLFLRPPRLARLQSVGTNCEGSKSSFLKMNTGPQLTESPDWRGVREINFSCMLCAVSESHAGVHFICPQHHYSTQLDSSCLFFLGMNVCKQRAFSFYACVCVCVCFSIICGFISWNRNIYDSTERISWFTFSWMNWGFLKCLSPQRGDRTCASIAIPTKEGNKSTI